MTMKKLALATLVALGMSTAAIAQQPQPGQRPGQPSAQPPRSTQPAPQPRSTQPAPRGVDRTQQVPFDSVDENADGRLSRAEANEIEGFDFSRADTNNDASLSRQEYQAALATSTQRGGASARSGDAAGRERGGASSRSRDDNDRERGGASARSGAQDRDNDRGRDRDEDRDERRAQVTFDTADKNKDGEISRDEARDVDGLNFTSADTNDDQSLSRQEFQVAMAGRQPRG